MIRKTIAVTMGDPAGVGPELCLRILADGALPEHCRPLVFGDAELLARVARDTGIPECRNVVPLREWQRHPVVTKGAVIDCGVVRVGDVSPGTVAAACGQAAYDCVRLATEAALAGHVDAIATGPLHKAALRLAGIRYPGHTEIFADLTGASRICMMMASERLTVSLATIHVAISDVPGLLSCKGIVSVIRLTDEAHRCLGKAKPRLCVCGLNPHAGEQGLFGDEEERIIRPAIEEARSEGLDVEGPLPADTAFLESKRAIYDAYIVMYHDQGLIPFKMLSFDTGVNVTLGLPIVRTSVDHGTAFDIAWKGEASAGSLTEAVLWADRLSGSLEEVNGQ